MVKSNKLFGQASQPGISPTYQQADKTNKEGFPAFSRSLEEDTLSVLMTQTMGNTFYVGKKELAKELVEVIEKMAAKDPEFLAKALVYARQHGLMKLAPTIGLTVLSAKDKPERKVNFRKAFKHVVKIPDDLREFVSLCRTGQIRTGPRVKLVTEKRGNERVVVRREVSGDGVGGLGGEARDAVKRWLQHMSEYHAVKYGSAKSEGITLRDIIRMSHPRPKTKAQEELFGWLVKGWEKVGPEPSPTNPMVWAFETIKRISMENEHDEKEIISLVETYKLPWEVVVPSVKKMTKGIWKALLKGMPYMALLRQLNTLNRHGVLEDKEIMKSVAARLSDSDSVKKSKQLPFRFSNAYRAFEGPQEVRDALVDALEVSFENVPEIPGTVCISNDISSSMASPVSDKSKAMIFQIAAMFGSALFKKCKDAIILPFDDTVHPELGRVSKRDSVMTIAEKIGVTRGGTNLGAPIEYLTQQRQKIDVFIGLTDNEDWAGRGFLTYWETYKRTVNPNAKAFLVTLAPHRDYPAPSNYPGVYFVFGWAESILRYIPMVLKGGTGQIEDVKKLDLETLDKKEIKKEVEVESGEAED